MDVISQAVFGATLSQSFAKDKTKQFIALIIGALAGMAPDLDVFIQSSSDPLLFLEFHRQFTHSLIFIPFGALLCTVIFYFFVKNKLSFLQVYLFSFLGYATHGLLDACTSYGTQLFWPFSTERVSWNIISIVDPFFTLPIIIGIIYAVFRNSRLAARITFTYAVVFLCLGVIQKQRALITLYDLALLRGHQVERVLVKPSFANRHVWKMIYEHDGRYYVDAVKILWNAEVISGASIPKLNLKNDFKQINLTNRQEKDIERFRWFSNDFLAIDPDNKNIIMDVRYSFIPNEIKLMWGIEILESAHVGFITKRGLTKKTKQEFWEMLF